LVDHFNNILYSHIPQSYKISLIIPIPKPKKDKSQISSHRPISLNPCQAKLLDKVIANRLWWFASHKLLDSRQLGFKRDESVTDILLYLDYEITDSLSAQKHLSLISLNFDKAFEKIGIHSILDQLQEWGVGPRIRRYIYNFMTKRKIKVRVGSNIFRYSLVTKK